MRQLSEWGWMHHLARHSVACFLTRGDLYISWEEGKAVFEELLLDAVRTGTLSLLHVIMSYTTLPDFSRAATCTSAGRRARPCLRSCCWTRRGVLLCHFCMLLCHIPFCLTFHARRPVHQLGGGQGRV
jgi:hypothetical protein